jgi:hypothetical protein
MFVDLGHLSMAMTTVKREIIDASLNNKMKMSRYSLATSKGAPPGNRKEDRLVIPRWIPTEKSS